MEDMSGYKDMEKPPSILSGGTTKLLIGLAIGVGVLYFLVSTANGLYVSKASSLGSTLGCASPTQSTGIGQVVNYEAKGGSGNYSWSDVETGKPLGVGSKIQIVYEKEGAYQVNLYSNQQSAVCTVFISLTTDTPTPAPTPIPTPTPNPRVCHLEQYLDETGQLRLYQDPDNNREGDPGYEPYCGDYGDGCLLKSNETYGEALIGPLPDNFSNLAGKEIRVSYQTYDRHSSQSDPRRSQSFEQVSSILFDRNRNEIMRLLPSEDIPDDLDGIVSLNADSFIMTEEVEFYGIINHAWFNRFPEDTSSNDLYIICELWDWD